MSLPRDAGSAGPRRPAVTVATGRPIAGLSKPATCRDVSTTMIYTHVLNRGGRGVRSPLDR